MVKNMMFYLLENSQIGDYTLLKKGVKDIASKGFDSIMLQIRDTAFQLDDTEVIKSVAIVIDEAHRLGLTVTLAFITTNCRSWWYSFFKKNTKAGEVIVKKVEGQIKNGKLRACFTFPTNTVTMVGRFDSIFASFIANDDCFTILPDFKYNYYVKRSAGIDDAGEWFVAPESEFEIEGDIPTVKQGKVVLYVGFLIMNPDYTSEEFAEFMEYLLEKYRGIKLDGIAWDEPAGAIIGPNYYRLSKDVCVKFYHDHGYDIKEKVYALDYPVPESTQVRYDYFSTIIKVLYDAQKRFVKKGKELFGNDVFSGIHHTWVGESTIQDLWAGCIDYFTLSDNLSGGMTDCAFADEKSVVYTYRLAKSIGKYHQNNLAYSNCWCFCPNHEKMTYFSSLMAIWNIYWIGHAYGHALAGFGPGYPHSKTWDDMAKYTKRISKVSEFLGEAEEVVKIAVYHSWESVAQINTFFTSLYKTTQLNLSYELVKNNYHFDFIGTKQLSGSCIAKGNLKLDKYSYNILIMIWPNLLPDKVWGKVKQYSKLGGKVIFIGPPAQETIGNKNISKDFFDLIGVEQFSIDDYIGNYLINRRMPIDRISQSRYFYPLKPLNSQPVFGDEYGIAGIKKNHIYYISAIDPSWFIIKIIDECGYTRNINCNSSNVIYNVLKKGDRKYIAAIGKYGQSFSGRFDFDNGFLEIEKANLLCAKIEGKEITILGENIGKVKSNLNILAQEEL